MTSDGADKSRRSSSSLSVRVASALVLGPLALACIFFGGSYFACLLAVGAMLMVYEFVSLMRLEGPWTAIFVLISGVFALSLFLVAMGVGGVMIWYIAVGLTSGALALLGSVAGHKRLTWLGLSVAYIWIPVLSLLWLRSADNGGALVLWVFVLVWGTDIGGYFVGRAIGGPKLAPKVSPNKTWSGLVGGIVFSLLAAASAWLLVQPMDLAWMLILTPPLAIWSQLGDIAESAMKRRWGVKDSGRLIPGHGGILDRVDGLIPVAPLLALFIYVYAMT